MATHITHLFFRVLFVTTLFFASSVDAQTIDHDIETKAVTLTKKLLGDNNIGHSTLDHKADAFTQENKIIDAIFDNDREKIIQFVESGDLINNEHRQYFKAYAAIIDLSIAEAIQTKEYGTLQAGLKHDDWYAQHLSSILLSMVHSRAEITLDSLKHAENALRVVPPEKGEIADSARYNSYHALHISFTIDGDLNGVIGTIDQLIRLTKQSDRKSNKFNFVNNLAVVLENNGDIQTATKITALLIEYSNNETSYNQFIANLSHGRFLLKADRPQDSIDYLKQAIKLAPQDEYKAFLLIDLANAQAKVGLFDDAESSLKRYADHSKNAVNTVHYAERNIEETLALIAAGNEQHKDAFELLKKYTSKQISYFKEGLSADRRQANRRVILSQELAKKDVETAKLQLELEQAKLAQQRALIKFYLTLLLIGVIISFATLFFVRKLTSLNRQLKVASAEAEENAKIKSQLMAMFSHEMLTPLNGIIPLADVLGGAETDIKKKQLLKTIEVSGQALAQKINDIIILANPQDQTSNPSHISVKSFLHDVLLQHHHLKPENVEFNVRVSPDTPYILNVDAGRLRAIISALISNAFKYTKLGEVRMSVYMSDDAHPVLEITDTGTGMDESQIEDMMKPFGQSSLSMDRNNQGLGLGLTIARLQCLIIGAEFKMRSQEDLGTVIQIKLPNAMNQSGVSTARPTQHNSKAA